MEASSVRKWWSCRIELTERDRRNQRRAIAWLMAWISSFVATTALFRLGWISTGGLAMLLALVPTALGVGGVFAYRKFLSEADELQRKIQVEALALGFGAGLVATFGYSLLERAGAPRSDVTDPTIVMVLFWALGVWLGTRRYA